MEEFKIFKEVELKDPVMIAGWPGMGSVALGVVDYLRRKLASEKLAEIHLDPMATIDSVVVENGVADLPPGAQEYAVLHEESGSYNTGRGLTARGTSRNSLTE
ncbi:MAG: PAC2 family protein [Candidatus Omnitrophica bacterium]|nr:PAC2 family protein [Candidatus Omnitrophota bacterium]MBU1808120.1 PAC2 family protein [Candidatus Omnitrophota bacterium]